MLTPRASTTSALPQRLEKERLPCLATRTPQPATTNAVAVEILNVPRGIPARAGGVHQGIAPRARQILLHRSARAHHRGVGPNGFGKPDEFLNHSPFIRNAARNIPIWGVPAAPERISSITARASGRVRSRRATTSAGRPPAARRL